MHTSPAIGAYRLKIRSILLGLVSGIEVHHEKVATREGFDSDEFQLALSERVRAGGLAVTVVESFIDARLARYTVTRWPGVAVTVFLTASEQLRARGKSTVMRTYASAGAVVVAPGPTRPLTLLLR